MATAKKPAAKKAVVKKLVTKKPVATKPKAAPAPEPHDPVAQARAVEKARAWAEDGHHEDEP